MKNIGAVLAEMGLRYDHIMKTTIFVKDLNDFDGRERSICRIPGRAVSGTQLRGSQQTA